MPNKPQSVHGFHNLPALFGGEIGEDDMGYTRKDTADRLDKIIQFIWLFQQKHEGASPSAVAIGNEIDSPSVSWFLKLLIDDDRLEKISSKPYRVRILEHPKNKAAIKRLQRALEAAAAIETGKHHEHSDKGIALPPSKPVELTGGAEQDPSPAAQIEPPAVAEISPPVAEVATPSPSPTAGIRFKEGVQTWAQAVRIIELHGGDLELIARTYIMQTAKVGDLLEQLLDRGYTVAKTHPRWKD